MSGWLNKILVWFLSFVSTGIENKYSLVYIHDSQTSDLVLKFKGWNTHDPLRKTDMSHNKKRTHDDSQNREKKKESLYARIVCL